MQSWMVCGSRRAAVIVRRREFVVVGASLFGCAATAVPVIAAMAAPVTATPTRDDGPEHSWPSFCNPSDCPLWVCGSASLRHWPVSAGGPSRLVPLLAGTRVCTTHSRPQDSPHKSARRHTPGMAARREREPWETGFTAVGAAGLSGPGLLAAGAAAGRLALAGQKDGVGGRACVMLGQYGSARCRVAAADRLCWNCAATSASAAPRAVPSSIWVPCRG